jgi:tetratricopeptide (TPR) repeat protein
MSPSGQAFSRTVVAGLLLCPFFFFIAGCSSVSIKEVLRNSRQLPELAKVGGVPLYAQEDMQCGPASLAMVLAWSGLPASPDDLAAEVFTPERQGSLQSALIASARRHGRIAYPLSGTEQLFAEVAAGRPVIVLLNLAFSWFPRYHYAVVIGFDRKAETVFLHSGTLAEERLSFRVFGNIWARSEYWGLLILPPGEMPVAPDEQKWLEAIVGLERTGHWQAAAVAYGRASVEWPRNANVWIGLGNSRYVQHEFAGAISAYRQAVSVNPESAVAFNNLAQVLAETGQVAEAMTAARRAVEIGGPLQETYRRTLAEIMKSQEDREAGDGR